MWPFKKKKIKLIDQLKDLLSYEDNLYAKGFLLYTQHPALIDAVCVFVRSSTKDAFTARACEFDPSFNVANLWWKPWNGVTIEQTRVLN